MNSDRNLHSALTCDLVAPICSGSAESLIEAEDIIFKDELKEKAASFAAVLKKLVTLQLAPASAVVMEQFADKYAETHITGESRQQRIAQHYKIGAVIGLAATALSKEHEVRWFNCSATTEFKEIDPDKVVGFASLINYDTKPERADLVDLSASDMVLEVADHLSKDLEDQNEAIDATLIGYYAARELASLSLDV